MKTRPSKIVCVGRSYADHVKELNNAMPGRPVLFIKPPSSLIGLDEGISWNPAWVVVISNVNLFYALISH
ncbi:hypothetical protein C6W84_0590 [Acinetobacter baumannii]|nr:hypothetical protein C6W84_0590 [Acinetobacter baumannii]